MASVRVTELTVGYRPGVPVLHGVSLTVAGGRMVAVTGASGAGKTTLLRAVAGLLTPQSGSVVLAGASAGGPPLAADRPVLIPQHNGLAAILTAAENLQVALVAAGLPPGRARRDALGALARLGLEAEAGRLVEELSGGQQQRTAVARGIALRGEVLLADESSSELDAGNRQRVLELLRAEADRGAAVVFATHDPQVAAACDEVVQLVDGRVDHRLAGAGERVDSAGPRR